MASIYADVGTVTSTSTPGNMVFGTTSIGATAASEKMRITPAGNVGIGTSSPGYLLHLRQNGNPDAWISATNSGTNSAGITLENEGQRNWSMFADRATGMLRIGCDFRAVTLATFTASGKVAFGGSTNPSECALVTIAPLTGNAFPAGIRSGGTVATDGTSRADYFQAITGTTAGATYSAVVGYQAQQGTLAGTVTTQIGFRADGSMTGGTNNCGFVGEIAAGTNRWNLFMSGTAANYLAGNVGIGTPSFGTSAATVIAIANGTAPTTSPTGVGQLYVEGGALKYRGSSGTVTTIANA
jgi:hypothetical protein